MKTLSLCMIVKNEEKSLENCLKNAKEYSDEIIIIDTGSRDKTKQIALKFTDKVYDYEWVQDFSKARNFSFDKSSCQYIMWLDGDDFVPEESVNEINAWKISDDDSDVLMCRYVNSYDEKLTPIFQYYRERIVKNCPSLRWNDPVHEVIIPSGKVTTNEKIAIYHVSKERGASDRNLNIYLKIINDGVNLSPRQQFYYARELFFNNKISQAIHEFSKFLADDKGWIENKIEACLDLAKCYEKNEDFDKALSALYGSFIYDDPRGEFLYEIGNVFSLKKEYKRAIYWYKLAMQSTPNLSGGGFVNQDCYDFLPALGLCFCYDKIGEINLAYQYHLITEKLHPQDKSVVYNKKYFENNLSKIR